MTSPLILSSTDTRPHISPKPESDCACPENGFVSHSAANIDLDAVYQRPSLHQQPLSSNFHLLFNPVSEQSDVVVVNEVAHQLLQTFETPQPLEEALNRVENFSGGWEALQRLARLSLLEPVDAPYQLQSRKPDTLTAWLHITNKCSLRCPYCYLRKTPEDMELMRAKQAVDAVFRSALAHNFHRVKLKYAGGEATMNFTLVAALHEYGVQQAANHGLVLDGVVLSNGVAISERIIRQLQRLNLRLMISLDGVGTDHDTNRPFINGQGSFQHVERSLDRLAAHDFTPTVSVTISRRNAKGLPRTVAYLLERKLPFSLNFYRENECSSSFTDLAYQDEEIIAAMKRAFVAIENNLPAYSLLHSLVDRARLDISHKRPCGVGESYMVIDQHGSVAQCHMEIEQTVTNVMTSDPLQLLIDEQSSIQNLAVDEKEGCRDCHWRYQCAGGCPALTYRVTGRFDIKSPNCRIYKALFPAVLRLEGLRILKYSSSLLA